MKQIAPVVMLTLAGLLSFECQSALPAKISPPEHSATTPVPRQGVLGRHETLNELASRGNIDLVFLGDSITREWDVRGTEVWQEYYGDRRAANFGVGAERTEHVLWRIDNGNFDGKLNPKLIVLQIGTNNVLQNTAEEIADGVLAITLRLRHKLPETKILLLAIFPRGINAQNIFRQKIAATNDILKTTVNDEAIHYLDISDHFLNEDGTISTEIMADYLHLTTQGYRIWARAIESKVSELLKEED